MDPTEQGEELRSEREQPLGVGSWVVTIILCLAFSTIGAFWMKWASFPGIAAGLSEAVPPIPAIATLLFLLAMGAVLRRLAPWFRLARVQLITVYAFVSVSVSIGFINLYRSALAWTNTTLYIRDQNITIAEIAQYVPEWLAPTNEQIMLQFWQGGTDVPWEQWIVPLLSLGGIFLAFYVVMIAMLRLFYKRWSQEERLIFPVAEFALSLVEPEERRGRKSIFRRGIFWVGCGVALIFNLFYIVPALHPTMSVPPQHFDATQFFDTNIGWWQIRLNPIIFGLGYLVSLNVLFSIWVSFLFMKIHTGFLASRGVSSSNLFRMDQQMGIGAYLAIACAVTYAARKHLWKALTRVLPGVGEKASDPMEPGRWTVVLFLVGVGALMFAMIGAGMVWWLALIFLVMVIVRGLVMARVRAQAGMPIIYFDVGQMRDLPWLLGGTVLAAAGMEATAGLVFMGFLANLTLLAPHHADAFKLAERTRLGTRRWVPLAILAVVFGLLLVNITHMPPIYEHGAVNIGGMRSSAFTKVPPINAALRETPANGFKISMAGEGAVITAVLTYMRRFYWFPLHPLGFVIACAIGYRVVAPVFAAWFVKWVVLKYFGGSVHRKTRTFMIGLVLGHFMIAATWAILAVFRWPPTERYFIGFW
jgi:hypothetical protein